MNTRVWTDERERWFAWRPVCTDYHGWVWFRFTWRRWLYISVDGRVGRFRVYGSRLGDR